ncbi:hypothetical protein MRX96_011429 [Rhipicephalus microplus]
METCGASDLYFSKSLLNTLSGYVKSQDGHIVPTSQLSISASAAVVQMPAATVSCGSLHDSPERCSLSVYGAAHRGSGQGGVVDVDDVVVEEFDDVMSEVDANDALPTAAAEGSSPSFFWERHEDRPPRQPLERQDFSPRSLRQWPKYNLCKKEENLYALILLDSTASGKTGRREFPCGRHRVTGRRQDEVRL